MSDPISFTRRRFVQVGAGAAVTAALAACSSRSSSLPSSSLPSSSLPTSTAPTTNATSGTTAASGTGPASTTVTTTLDTTVASSSTAAGATGARTLVIVQLNGGNDGLNTLVPSDGRYRDARPTLGIPESDLVALTGNSDWSLHPSLAPLTTYWDAGTATFLPGIGFDDPNHSHFVSLDRWWRADDLSASTGWLGRNVVPGDLSPLYATALGSGAPLLRSDLYQPAVVIQPAGFDFPKALPADVLQRLAQPASADSLHALAQASMTSTIAAVGSFAGLLASNPDTSTTDDQVTYREGGLDLVQGLDLAARLVTGDVGARVVVVSAGGFDTHSNQLVTQKALFDDLAKGIDAFMQAVAAAGATDRTLLVTTSEFGRRVEENASGGLDHGAGGLSMMFGGTVVGGIQSAVDLGNQLDGDVRPSLDPRTMYTACLDWLGLDPVAALGKRYDQVALLKT
ncbi:MAG: putative arylsulfatase family enzyme twin-arginine signal [Ilumatobacteraceae bacterium]|nr:putative arylsulfatase family enzyme twin-arginine signal [Ilumatobacteraceae bacterium]